MRAQSQILLIIAALLGFSGVALGAFGAHGLRAILEATGHVATWEKAVFYQLIHALALLALMQTNKPVQAANKIGWCWIVGIACFSGSLYSISLGGPVRLLWPITPLGGLAMMAGWGWLSWSAWQSRKP